MLLDPPTFFKSICILNVFNKSGGKMKKLNTLIILFLISFILSSISFGQESELINSKITSEDIEKNLVVGVETDNLGLKISSAYYLGERKSSKAVIPLMDVLHTDKSEEARIIAAVSLYKIGDARGIWAIQRAAEFDESESVKRLCKIFHNMYLKENNSK